MHHRDLSRRTAEAEQRDAQPDLRRLLQRNFVLGNLGNAAEDDRVEHSSSRGLRCGAKGLLEELAA